MNAARSMDYCDVCKRPFSGPVPATQHYESEAHKKKVRNIALFLGEGGDGLLPAGMDHFYCDVCHVTFPNQQSLDVHKRQCSGRETGQNQPQGVGNASAMDEDGPVTPVMGIDGTKRYRCKECDIWANSATHLKIHKEGKSHKKKVKQLAGNPADATEWFVCEICEKKLNSPRQLAVHKLSHGIGVTSSVSVPPPGVSTSLAEAAEALRKGKVNLPCQNPHQVQKDTSGDPQITVKAEKFNNLNITEDEKVICKKLNNSEECLSIESSSSYYVSCESSPAADKCVQMDNLLKIHASEDADQTLVKQVWTSLATSNQESPHRLYHEDEKPRKPLNDLGETRVKVSVVSNDASCPSDIAGSRRVLSSRPDQGPGEAIPVLGSGYFCTLCNIPLSGVKPKEQHEFSAKHIRNLAMKNKELADLNEKYIVSVQSTEKLSHADVTADNHSGKTSDVDVNPFPHSHSYCKTCCVPFTSEKNRDAHMKGRQHMHTVKFSEPAPQRPLPDIIKNDADCGELFYNLTTTVPRAYQCELFEKAMKTDSLCFLPTGTGKTLTGCMVMSCMLKLNPQRPVVFLVDKVLLVHQQSKYIETELQHFEFQRMDFESQQLGNRELRIAALCGRQHDSGSHALPLWKHDIIISTAAYFRNLLEKRLVNWSDLSLVVFDEVHHCARDHPFNTLLRHYHHMLNAASRPKILGLTASPAGKKNVDQTEAMLRELLGNLGAAQIAVVQEYKKMLEKFQSSASLVIREINMTPEESHLLAELRTYLLSCYDFLEDVIEFENMDSAFAREIAENDIQRFLRYMIDSVKQKITKAGMSGLDNDIQWHVGVVCNACRSLGEFGVTAAYAELAHLLDKEYPGSFESVNEKGLQCEKLLRLTLENQMSEKLNINESSTLPDNPALYPAARMLLVELHDQIDWKKEMKSEKPPPMALVLVKERVTVKLLESALKADATFQQLGVKVVSITGHGNGAEQEGGGMTVSQQKRILEELKQHRYQVIVATSVAEEGIDLPECELVVEMDPPSTVTSLIQIRGRARKKGGRFVAICRQQGAKEKIDNLLLREKHMEEACRRIVEVQCKGSDGK